MSELINSNKRFGTIAAEKGFIDRDDVTEALAIQAQENIGQSYHRKIGVILFDLGHINAGQIRHVLGELRRSARMDS